MPLAAVPWALAGAWEGSVSGLSRLLAPYVRIEAAKRLFDENANGTDHGNRLWMLYAASIWLEGAKAGSLPKATEAG